MKKTIAAALAFSAFAIPTAALAVKADGFSCWNDEASFPCREASGLFEKTVCSDPDLKRAECFLGLAERDALSANKKQADRLSGERARWRSSTEAAVSSAPLPERVRVATQAVNARGLLLVEKEGAKSEVYDRETFGSKEIRTTVKSAKTGQPLTAVANERAARPARQPPSAVGQAGGSRSETVATMLRDYRETASKGPYAKACLDAISRVRSINPIVWNPGIAPNQIAVCRMR